MGDKSTIEWTDATWNPVTGCTKVSQGCKHCYAERVFPRPYPGRAFTDVRRHPERLDAPLRWRKSRRVFVNSMSDLFHEDVPAEFIGSVWGVMSLAPRHTFQILTKRPERMKMLVPRFATRSATVDGSGWPLPNVWLGVSVEDQATADERIPLLLQTPAAIRFVSYEPALGPIQILDYLMHTENIVREGPHDGDMVEQRDLLHWVIAGGESGPHARPAHPDWFRSVRDQCAVAGVPFFFKQWGEWLPGSQYTDELAAIDTNEVFSRFDSRRWDGQAFDEFDPFDPSPGEEVYRVGKKRAGRLLDGREHSEYPA